MLAESFFRYLTYCAAACAFLLPFAANSAARADGLEAKGDYFPIGVWLQDPANARKYKAVGINTYIGLYNGPTEAQLSTLEKAGMKVACDQNAVSLDPKWNKVVVGWLQDDEPDNAQSLPNGGGYGPPVLPSVIVERYKKMKAADKENRPVMLNLGMGVSWDNWFGRGTRTNKPEDYPLYVKGGDMVSFDIYPACGDPKTKEVAFAGKLSYVGSGVKRLVGWVEDKKPVWTCIETTHIGNPNAMATPKQVRDEVWMAIINGAHGIIYFAHEFKPKFIEAGLLAHKDIAASVKSVNAEVQALASVINDGKPIAGAAVDDKNVTIMTRKLGGETYLFATGMDAGPIKATFTLPGMKGNQALEVIGEPQTTTHEVAGGVDTIVQPRVVNSSNGTWSDTFTGYEAHIYHVKAAGN